MLSAIAAVRTKSSAREAIARLIREGLDPEPSADGCEQECLEGYARAREQGRSKAALSRVRSFALSGPRRRGVRLVLEGDPEGWREIERWWLLDTLSSHLIGSHIASQAHVHLAYAFALGENVAATWMASALFERMKARPEAYTGQYYPRFLDYVYRAYFTKDADPATVRALGPYQAVVRAWGDPIALGDALAGICDYHVEKVSADDGEFGLVPLLPLELAAIAALRRERGERTPQISHPLSSTLLSPIPRRRTYRPDRDPWYQRAIDVAVEAQLVNADFRWPA